MGQEEAGRKLLKKRQFLLYRVIKVIKIDLKLVLFVF